MSNHSPLLPCALLAVTAILSLPAAAQNQTTTPSVKQDSDKTKPQEVEVKAKSEVENQRRDAAAKSIVSNADLIRYGDTNITEAMKRVPSVIVVKGTMQLPGMNSGYTQILVDGEPPRGISINDIPMQSIERVEIYRLGSAEFSSQGVAGTINIILKKVPQTKQNNLTLALFHDAKTVHQATWMSSDKWDNLSYSVTASTKKYAMDFWNRSKTQEIDLEKNVIREYTQLTDADHTVQSYSINPVIQYKKPDGFSLRITSAIQASDSKGGQAQYYQFLKGSPIPFPSNTHFDEFHDVGGNTSIKLLDTIGENTKLDLNLNLSGRRSNIHNSEHNFINREQLGFERRISSHDQESRITTSLKLTAPSSEEHDIVGGINLSSSHNRNERKQTLNFISVAPELLGDTSNLQTTRSVVDNYAAFIQDEWKFRKASSAYFGLRWENVRVFSEGNSQSNARNTSSVWSPIVQTLWQLNPDNTDRLRFGISRTFKAPNNFFLVSPKFITTNNSQDRPSYRGNPNLKPELAWSFEASYEHNDKEEFAYSVKAIARKISGLHRPQTSYFEQFWWRQFVNAGEAISKNLNFNTQFPLKRFWRESPNINISFDASKNWSSVSYLPAPDNRLTAVPFSTNLNLDYTAKEYPLTVGSSLRYSQARPILVTANQRNFPKSMVNHDIYALWKFTPKTKLRFAIDNVLNRQSDNLTQWFNEEGEIWQTSRYRSYRQLRLTFDHGF